MSKKLYLFSLGMVILVSALGALQGSAYILSPVGLFQVATLLNMVLPVALAILLTVFLSARFADVWRNRVDTHFTVTRPIARASQFAGRILIWTFYILLIVAIVFLVLARGQLSGEIAFLFGPLLRTLPVGLLLFELSRFLDAAEEQDDN